MLIRTALWSGTDLCIAILDSRRICRPNDEKYGYCQTDSCALELDLTVLQSTDDIVQFLSASHSLHQDTLGTRAVIQHIYSSQTRKQHGPNHNVRIAIRHS